MFNPIYSLETSLNIPSPLQELHSDLLFSKRLTVHIKRDDLIDPYISGNKYRKLKGHLEYYHNNSNKYQGILSFGGAYSNHLYATSAVCHRLGIPFTAIVRGEEVDLENTTLSLLVNHGDTIHRISRLQYRLKETGNQVTSILANQHLYVIPEGGNSPLSQTGVNDIFSEITKDLKADFVALASGTGATSFGLLNAIQQSPVKLLVCAGVRDKSVKQRLEQVDINNQLIWFDEEWGGFGKKKSALIDFMEKWSEEYHIPLEYVYTGKLMHRLWSLIKADYFEPGTRLVVIHTGGLRPPNH